MPELGDPIDCDALCRLLQTPLQEAGFSLSSLELLAANRCLLRSTLARATSAMTVQPDLQACSDPRFPHAAAFTSPVSPLPLEPLEWVDFIDERNRMPGQRACEIMSGADYGRERIFTRRTGRPPSTLLLVETSKGTRAESDLVRSAETLLPGSTTTTNPRLIFEVLRYFWTGMSEINAAYVMVADPARESGAPMPILFNPPKGPLRLGLVNQVPKNFGYNGYLAYSV
jgi:hypothetical protein